MIVGENDRGVGCGYGFRANEFRAHNRPKTEVEGRLTEQVPHDIDHPNLFDEGATARRLERATDITRFLIEDCVIGRYDAILAAAGGNVNRPATVPEHLGDLLGTSKLSYVAACFEHGSDEALILTIPRPLQRDYWSAQLGDVWSRSLNFRDRQTGLNDRHIIANSDGSSSRRNDDGTLGRP